MSLWSWCRQPFHVHHHQWVRWSDGNYYCAMCAERKPA